MERSGTVQGGRQIMLNNTPNPGARSTARPTLSDHCKLPERVNDPQSSPVHIKFIFGVNVPRFGGIPGNSPAPFPPPPPPHPNTRAQAHKLTVPGRYGLDFHPHVRAALDAEFCNSKPQTLFPRNSFSPFCDRWPDSSGGADASADRQQPQPTRLLLLFGFFLLQTSSLLHDCHLLASRRSS